MTKKQIEIIKNLMELYTHYEFEWEQDGVVCFALDMDEKVIFKNIDDFKDFRIEKDIYECLDGNDDDEDEDEDEKDFTIELNVVGLDGDVELHIVIAHGKGMLNLDGLINTYLDDEVSGDNVNSGCEYDIEEIY